MIACLLQKNYPMKESLLGNIHNYCPWGISFDQCDDYKYLPEQEFGQVDNQFFILKIQHIV